MLRDSWESVHIPDTKILWFLEGQALVHMSVCHYEKQKMYQTTSA